MNKGTRRWTKGQCCFFLLFAQQFLCGRANERRVWRGQMAASYDAEEEQSSSGLSFTGRWVLLYMQSMEWIYVGVEGRGGRKELREGYWVLTRFTAACVCWGLGHAAPLTPPAVRETNSSRRFIWQSTSHRDLCTYRIVECWAGQSSTSHCWKTVEQTGVGRVWASFGIKNIGCDLSNLLLWTEDLNWLKLCHYFWDGGSDGVSCGVVHRGSSHDPLRSHVMRADIWDWCCLQHALWCCKSITFGTEKKTFSTYSDTHSSSLWNLCKS